jgi:hypothetical protein
VIELYSLCRTSWERLSSESRLYLSRVEVLLIMCYRLLTPMFNDSHPCVRYAACQSVYVPLSAVSRAHPTNLSKL